MDVSGDAMGALEKIDTSVDTPEELHEWLFAVLETGGFRELLWCALSLACWTDAIFSAIASVTCFCIAWKLG